jgi:hypothetical protein
VSFHRRLVESAGGAGWLRFTRVSWAGWPIAFHLGFSYRSCFLWYKPSFAIELARRSPGEVLLRQLFLAAVGEEARVFDFGLGEEPFKRRFASHLRYVDTIGLYPAASEHRASPAARHPAGQRARRRVCGDQSHPDESRSAGGPCATRRGAGARDLPHVGRNRRPRAIQRGHAPPAQAEALGTARVLGLEGSSSGASPTAG